MGTTVRQRIPMIITGKGICIVLALGIVGLLIGIRRWDPEWHAGVPETAWFRQGL